MPPGPYPKLLCERLLLRRFEESDARDVQQLAGALEVAEMTLNIPHPYEDGMAETWINTHQDDFISRKGVVFALVSNASSKLMGAMGLIINQNHNRAELGYWIGKPFWGQGYATEAAKEVLRFSFDDLSLHRIHATHMIHNPASGRVMQKIGMSQEGTLKQHALKWDRFVDLAVYGILADTWRKSLNV